ncbi:hypothetical protein EMCRGX_G011718 [Ephydatia muelleri]
MHLVRLGNGILQTSLTLLKVADVTLPSDALMLFEDLIVPLLSVYELALPPKCIVQWNGEHKHFKRFDDQSAKEMQTLNGLRATPNPMLEIRVNLYRRTPVEVFHTLLLGRYKYLVKEFIPKLTERMKEEVPAGEVHATFPHSGLTVKMHKIRSHC